MTGQELLVIIQKNYDKNKSPLGTSSSSIKTAKALLKKNLDKEFNTPWHLAELIFCFQESLSPSNKEDENILTKKTLAKILEFSPLSSGCTITLNQCSLLFEREKPEFQKNTLFFLIQKFNDEESLDWQVELPRIINIKPDDLWDKWKFKRIFLDLCFILNVANRADPADESYIYSPVEASTGMDSAYNPKLVSHMLQNAIHMLKALARGGILTKDRLYQLLDKRNIHVFLKNHGLKHDSSLTENKFNTFWQDSEYHSLDNINQKFSAIRWDENLGQKIENYEALSDWLQQDNKAEFSFSISDQIREIIAKNGRVSFILENFHHIILMIKDKPNDAKHMFDKKCLFLTSVRKHFEKNSLNQEDNIADIALEIWESLDEKMYQSEGKIDNQKADSQGVILGYGKKIAIREEQFLPKALGSSNGANSMFEVMLVTCFCSSSSIKKWNVYIQEWLKEHDSIIAEKKEQIPEWIVLEAIVACIKDVSSKSFPWSIFSKPSDPLIEKSLKEFFDKWMMRPNSDDSVNQKRWLESLECCINNMQNCGVKKLLTTALRHYSSKLKLEKDKCFTHVTPYISRKLG